MIWNCQAAVSAGCVPNSLAGSDSPPGVHELFGVEFLLHNLGKTIRAWATSSPFRAAVLPYVATVVVMMATIALCTLSLFQSNAFFIVMVAVLGCSWFGIGLNIVQALVRLHGGTVTVRSEGVNRGSEFVIRLPLSSGELADRLPSQAASAPQKVAMPAPIAT
jgi:hypothetical protein